MRSFQKQRGSLIVAALLLFAILLVLGLGIMSGQSARMRAARAQSLAIKARALAMAGFEDARVKLGKDALFLRTDDTQDSFTYSEDVYDPDDGSYVGNYVVIIDLRWQAFTTETSAGVAVPGFASRVFELQSIYPITCIGKLSDQRVGDILAERELYFELDVRNWNIIRMEDRGSL